MVDKYIEKLYGDIKEEDRFMYAPDISQSKQDFKAGYRAAIEEIKEYLFNTENHESPSDTFYISPEYLKQTIKFLNDSKRYK
jgi:hypothetical protein